MGTVHKVLPWQCRPWAPFGNINQYSPMFHNLRYILKMHLLA